jgi:hypothetical protein
MNHDPKTATATRKATYSVTFKGIQQLRGKDLNLRPLGYEPEFSLDATIISTTSVSSFGV